MKKTVTASYRFSCQVDPSNKNSPWHGSEITYAVETDDEEFDFQKASDELTELAKTQVFTNLNVEFDADSMQPVAVVTSPPTVETPKRRSQRTTKSASTLDTSSLPRVVVEGITFIDYRPAKVQNLVKPRFPDFKSENGEKVRGHDSFWLEDLDGKPTEFAELFGV